MKIGSLFSGIGGLELGLEWAGVGHTAWQVEIDPFCRDVLARHWPEARRFEDVREVDFGQLEPVDVICGGFPCQDVSNAGDRAGLAGARSGLWGELLRAIRLVGPRFAVVENVAALLARGMGTVLGDLAESRYDAEWDCLPAAAFGAPHRRDRVFLVAHPYGDGLRQQPEPELRREGAALPPDDGPAQHVADAHGVRQLQPQGGIPNEWGRPGNCGWWDAEPEVGRVVDGVSAGLDRASREAALGNAVVPYCARHVGRRLMTLSPPESGRIPGGQDAG